MPFIGDALRIHENFRPEENLKPEFEGVQRTYLPMHSVIRIDEVEKSGQGKITDSTDAGSTVTPFPVFTPGQKPPDA